MTDPKCRRCENTNEWAIFAKHNPNTVRKDAPYAFAGYCSAICQALDLRSALIDCGMFDPETQMLDVKPEALAKAKEFCWEDKTFGKGYITRGRGNPYT